MYSRVKVRVYCIVQSMYTVPVTLMASLHRVMTVVESEKEGGGLRGDKISAEMNGMTRV